MGLGATELSEMIMSRKKKNEDQLDLLAGLNGHLPAVVEKQLLPALKPIKLPKREDNFHMWIESCVAPVLQFTTDALARCNPEAQARLGTELVRILTQYEPPTSKVELHNHTHLTPQQQSQTISDFLIVDEED